jgi:tRNA pseudouridine55 synthase
VPRKDTARFHGFLIVDKPAGLTSHDVVARIRRLAGQRAVGHAGTLDPAATGVLPLALGDATRVLAVIDDASKTYRAEITFGVETDTYDIDGAVTAISDSPLPDRYAVERLLDRYSGTIIQVPPRHSAIQQGGRRLYDLARQGIAFDPPSRSVTIDECVLIGYQPPVLTLCVDCSSGTYIRSIAHDLGQDAGTGAYLSDLVRLRSGPFTLADAFTLPQLHAMDLAAQWPAIALHPDSAIRRTPAIILDDSLEQRWLHGQPLSSASLPTPLVRAYSMSGWWRGFGEIQSGPAGQFIQPRRVAKTEGRLRDEAPDDLQMPTVRTDRP